MTTRRLVSAALLVFVPALVVMTHGGEGGQPEIATAPLTAVELAAATGAGVKLCLLSAAASVGVTVGVLGVLTAATGGTASAWALWGASKVMSYVVMGAACTAR